MNNSYLVPLIEKASPIPNQFHQTFGQLSPNQFNWKPTSKGWSVGECIGHLIATNKVYFPIISSAIENGYKNPWISKVPGLSNMWGKMLLGMVSPDIKRKVKTLKPFEPSISAVEVSILDDFGQLQHSLIDLIKKSDVVDHDRTFIASPASKLITYNLKYTCNILIDHEQRHYNQAVSVMNRQEFPN